MKFLRVLVQSLRFAVRNLRANALRSFLTVLGMVIGVGAVILMVGLGYGAQQRVLEEFQSMGSDILFVFPGSRKRGVVKRTHGKLLRTEDAEAIRAECPSVALVAPERVKTVSVKYFEENSQIQVVGTTREYFPVRSLKLTQGRAFHLQEARLAARVCVLGSEVARSFFEGAPAVGQTLRIHGAPYEVVGVLEEKGRSGFNSIDDQIILPLGTFLRRIANDPFVRMISVKAADPTAVADAIQEIEALMKRRHPPPPGEETSVLVFDFSEVQDKVGTAIAVFAFLIVSGAVISLLVGGIGIMNIMLVSVTERTREIGLRKALGATRLDILVQFLGESVVVGAVGGLLGILGGTGITTLLQSLGGLNATIPTWAYLAAIGVSGGTGVVAGVYPAYKASRLNPIEALRWE